MPESRPIRYVYCFSKEYYAKDELDSSVFFQQIAEKCSGTYWLKYGTVKVWELRKCHVKFGLSSGRTVKRSATTFVF